MNISYLDFDRIFKRFIVVLAVIVLLGVVMVYSSSYIYARELYGNSGYYFLKQLAFLALSSVLAYIIYKTKYHFWIKYGFYINIFATLILILTFVPGLAVPVKGAKRWLDLSFMTLQPGEFIKYTLLLASIQFFESFNVLEKRERIKQAFFLLLPLLLLINQPDFGAFSICFLVLAFVCFMSSFPRQYFYVGFCSGLVIGTIVLFARPYRVKRLLAFLDPWKNPRGSGFQIIQSYMGFANGSLFGQGLGNSNEKLFYLPEAHNDFIFSVIGEELGFIGVLFIVILFVLLAYFGFRMALSVAGKLGPLLIGSVIFVITLQAAVNMGVVLGLLPTKGLNLPFISYGGSSLFANFFGLGLALSVARQYKERLKVTFDSTTGPFYHEESGYQAKEPLAATNSSSYFSSSRY